MKNPIQLEPHSAFKKAVVRKGKDGLLTYNYFKLVEVCKELHGWDDDVAQEWVDYNIVGLAINGFKVSYAQPRR